MGTFTESAPVAQESQSAPGADATAEAAPVEAPPAEETSSPSDAGGVEATTPEPAESIKYTALARRYAEIERQYRRSEHERKQQGTQFQELNEKFDSLSTRLKEDPFGYLEENGTDFNQWTARFLQKSPEEKAAHANEELRGQLKALQERIDTKDTDAATAVTSARQEESVQKITAALGQRPDLSFLAKLDQGPALYRKFAQHVETHGECPPDVQEELSQQLELNAREVVTRQVRALAEVPEFKKVILELADKLKADSDGQADTPAASESNGKEKGNGARPPSSLTNTQAAEVSERKVPQIRTRDERRKAILQRFKEKDELRRA